MDIAAKLSGKYTLAGCFQTAISPSARCDGCHRRELQVRAELPSGTRLDHFRAIFLQLNRRLNLLNVVEQGVLTKELERPSRRTQSAGIATGAERDLEVMNNSTKGRRIEEHDKAQKKSGYPVADSLANASSAIRRLGNGG